MKQLLRRRVFAGCAWAIDTACANFVELEWLRKYLQRRSFPINVEGLLMFSYASFAKRVAGGYRNGRSCC